MVFPLLSCLCWILHKMISCLFRETVSKHLEVYSRESKEQNSYTQYLFSALQWAYKGDLMGRFTGKEAATQKASSNALYNVHN